MTRRGWQLGALGLVVFCVITIAVAAVFDARVTPARAEGSAYKEQLLILDAAWKDGQAARKAMMARKIKPTATRCGLMFQATEASQIGNDTFRERGAEFFRYGCLNIKKMT
jgi:hypothetical protein